MVTCQGERSIDQRGWPLRLAGPLAPKTKASELAYRNDEGWQVAQLGAVPNTNSVPFHALTPSFSDHDADGTVVFRASWTGNPDQANNIGGGIYRLEGQGTVALVDSFTTVPGQPFRFNAFGIPDIEQGVVAFWGGRDGGQWTGLYLWRNGHLIMLADQAGSVAPQSAPDLRAGRIGFVGRDARGPAVFLWSDNHQGLTRVIGVGDPMPDGKVLEFLFDVTVGDNSAAFAVGYDSKRDERGIHMKHRILGWKPAGLWMVADESWFLGPEQQALSLQPNLAMDGDSVAFDVAVGYYSEIWVAEGCTLTRVAKSGDSVGQKTVRNFATIERESFSSGEILLVTNFTDGSQGYVSARRPTTRQTTSIAPAAMVPHGKPPHVALSFETITVETDDFKRHRSGKDCSDTYMGESGLREILGREAAEIDSDRLWLDGSPKEAEAIEAARHARADVLIATRRTLNMDIASATNGVLLCGVHGSGEIRAIDVMSGRLVQSAVVGPEQIDEYGGESQAFTGVARTVLRTLEETWRTGSRPVPAPLIAQ